MSCCQVQSQGGSQLISRCLMRVFLPPGTDQAVGLQVDCNWQVAPLLPEERLKLPSLSFAHPFKQVLKGIYSGG